MLKNNKTFYLKKFHMLQLNICKTLLLKLNNETLLLLYKL